MLFVASYDLSQVGDPNDVSDQVAGLPNFMGSGVVGTLRQAAYMDNGLIDILNKVKDSTNPSEVFRLTDSILALWARTGGLNQTAVERYASVGMRLYEGPPPTTHGGISWEQTMKVVEAFNGRYLICEPYTLDPTRFFILDWNNYQSVVVQINSAYNAIKRKMTNALLMQTQLAAERHDLALCGYGCSG